MHEIKEPSKLCDDEMRTFLDGTMCRETPRMGSLNKEDSQGKGDIETRKKFLDRKEDLFSVFFAMKTTS